MDCDHTVHLPGMLPDPNLWMQDEQELRPLLLDAVRRAPLESRPRCVASAWPCAEGFGQQLAAAPPAVQGLQHRRRHSASSANIGRH